jgi:hypothetical protein
MFVLITEIQHYLEKYSKLVTDQVARRSADLLPSVLEINTKNRISEQSLFKTDLDISEDAKKVCFICVYYISFVSYLIFSNQISQLKLRP